jgi:saccharopine dehydrogenase-like NADP-dependent oxidoreductase
VGVAGGPAIRSGGVKRIVVAGARGFFGSTVMERLRANGYVPVGASRRTAGAVRLDVEDRASIRASLRAGDVVVDATAPFQMRTTALIEEAIAIGFDVVDLCDNLAYARRVAALEHPAQARGIRLVNCCSSVSVLSALALRCSNLREPASLHGFLAPATRHTANHGVAESFLSNVGHAIEVWRGGAWQQTRGWKESREFQSLGRIGRVIETADSFTLPRAFPSLRTVDFWVDPNIRGAGPLLALASRVPAVVPLLSMAVRYGGRLARMLGSDCGMLAYEMEGAERDRATVVFRGRDSFVMAAIPAALAAERLAAGLIERAGLIPPDALTRGEALLEALEQSGIHMEKSADAVL